MKKIKCLDINVSYHKSGKGKQVLILMHGWGVSSELMAPISDALDKYFTVYNIDWPGFGESDIPTRSLSTVDYCEIFKAFVDNLKIVDPILIGHSFGCRIALRYASDNPVKKMILTGAAGLKPKRGLDYYVKVYCYKIMKNIAKIPGLDKIMTNKKIGSEDYQALSGIMRETFVKVVNEDVAPLLPKVKCETLLVFGDKDESTPLWMGEYLEKHLPNAGLAVFQDDDHYAYLHQLNRFIKVCEIFLKAEIKNV